MTKAAIFDMDGLMFDTERITAKAWLWTAERMGFELTAEQCDGFRGSNKEYKRQLFAKWYGDSVDYEKAFKMRQDMVDEYLEQNGVPVKKGLVELLEALKKKRYKVALATSTGRNKAAGYLESTGVMKFFDEMVYGNEVTNSKPDPEIFLKAADKLGVDIKDCIIFEDSPNGLKAARSAGAMVVMVPDIQQPDDELRKICDYVFEDLGQAISIL